MKTRKHALWAIGLLLLSGACSEPDSICACIDAGKQLDKKAQAILRYGSTEKSEKELQQLKAAKRKKCAEFEKMDGPQMLKRMEDCENAPK